MENNDRATTAVDLGDWDDTDRHQGARSGLSLHNFDADWFTLSATDRFDASNPEVSIGIHSLDPQAAFDVTVYYACAARGDNHGCPNGERLSDGTGCRRRHRGGRQFWTTLNASCYQIGVDDSGDATVRVVRDCENGDCSNDCLLYDLSFRVE